MEKKNLGWNPADYTPFQRAMNWLHYHKWWVLGGILVLALLTSLLDLIFKMPALRGANMFFGFVFGAGEAFIVTFLLAMLLSTLVSALGAIDPSLFGADVVENARICSFLLEHNLLQQLIDAAGLKF